MRLSNFLKGESGVTSLEYGVITALIAVVTVASTTNVGAALATSFMTLGTAVMSVVFGA